MAVTLNKANLVLKDANGNIGKIEQLSSNDLAKIRTAVSDVALVVNQSNHTPIKATANNLGVVKPDNNTIKIDSNGVLTATAKMPGVATTTKVGVVKPDGSTIKIDSNGVLTATAKMPGVATTTKVGVVKPDGTTITVDSNGTLTCGKTIAPVTGEIKWFAFKTVPTGYLVCNGAQVSRTTYANLFKAIGTTFGSGNGSTTFNLPDLRDRYIIGANTNALGTKIAEQLPNIKGGSNDEAYGHLDTGSSVNLQRGAITYIKRNNPRGSIGYNESLVSYFTLNAHNSNSIYTDGGHVYPMSLALLPCIKY